MALYSSEQPNDDEFEDLLHKDRGRISTHFCGMVGLSLATIVQ